MAKIHIDFSIHSSPYYLKVVDLSVWGLIENKPSIIEITLPGYANQVVKFYDKNKLNVFNSNMLGVNCEGQEGLVTLPDGIYEVVVKGSPSTYSNSEFYLKTDLFDMELDKVYIENKDDLFKKAFDEKLTHVELLKKGAQAHLRYGLIKEAGMLFEKAQELLEDLSNCATCS